MIQLYNGDCIERMKSIPDGSVDMVLCDLPYGTTARNDWDTKIPLEPLWEHLLRVTKPEGAIVMWSQMPYTAELISSMTEYFRYEWIVEKTNATGFLNANKMPLKAHENVLVFYRKLPTYNPQKTSGHKPVNRYTKHTGAGSCYKRTKTGLSGGGNTDRYPRDLLCFTWDTQKSKIHPTQKPVAANEYFIRTYTNPGETVLDCCMGSGSTGVAAVRAGRSFIGIELDEEYYKTAEQRIREEEQKLYI